MQDSVDWFYSIPFDFPFSLGRTTSLVASSACLPARLCMWHVAASWTKLDMTFQILLCCIDTLRGPYNDLGSFLFFAGGCFFYFTFVPCLCSFWPFSWPLSPLFHLMSLMTSGLCRFPLACMGLVFSIMLSDMFCWRKRRHMCYWIHLTFCVYQCLPHRIRISFFPGKCNPNFEWYLRRKKKVKVKQPDAETRHADQNVNHHCMTVESPSSFSRFTPDLLASLSPLTFRFPLPLPASSPCSSGRPIKFSNWDQRASTDPNSFPT